MTPERRNSQLPRLLPASGRDGGFGLVELMISMLIGLVIIGALVTLFVNTSGNNRELARANSMIESGRFAIKVLEDDLAHAGYWGGFVPMFDDQTEPAPPTDTPTAVPDPCLDVAAWTAAHKTNLIGVPLQAYDDPAAPDLATCVADAILDDYQANTDLLVVRHADTCVTGEGGYCEADVAGNLYVQAGFCGTEAAPYVFDTSGYTLHKLDCAAVAGKREFVSSIYYIRDYAVATGDGIPTLVRSQFDFSGGTLEHRAPVALVEGIEAFRIELGIDDVSKTGAAVDYTDAVDWLDPDDRTTPTNRGDGVPDGDYVRCSPDCTVDQLMNATSVRIHVLARSREASPNYTDSKTYTLGSAGAVGPFNDNFKRHVFTTTVRLPNIAGRRMSP